MAAALVKDAVELVVQNHLRQLVYHLTIIYIYMLYIHTYTLNIDLHVYILINSKFIRIQYNIHITATVHCYQTH